MGSEQNIHLQLVEERCLALKANPHQHHGGVGIGDEFLGDGVPARRIAIGEQRRRSFGVQVVERLLEVALLLVHEGLAIRDHQAQVADLRAINRWIEDFIQDAVRSGEPDAARRRVGSAYSVLFAGGPAGFDTRRAERCSLAINPAIFKLGVTHCRKHSSFADGQVWASAPTFLRPDLMLVDFCLRLRRRFSNRRNGR